MRAVAPALLLLIAATALAACSSDDDATASATTAAAPAPTDAPTAPPPAPSEPPPEPSAPPAVLGLAEWAAAFCASTQTREDDLASLSDGTDPTTLSLEDRVRRARELAAGELSAFDRSFTDLEAMDPPAAVAGYHRAVVAGTDGISDELRRQQALPDATSHEAIEALNAQLNIAFAEASAEVEAESQNLSVAALAALRGVTRCGALTSP